VWRQWQANDFASTTGKVTESKVVRGSGEDSHDYVEVHYRYMVDGRTYDRTRLRYDGVSKVRYSIEKELAKYPPQREVTVYYDPIDPGDSILERGIDPWSAALGSLLMALFHAPTFAFVVWWSSLLRAWWFGLPRTGISFRSGREQARFRICEFNPLYGALIGFGLASLAAVIVVGVLGYFIPDRFLVIPAWCGILIATIVGWRRSQGHYIEFRRNQRTGKTEVRRWDGTFELAPASDFESFFPKHRRKGDKDGQSKRSTIELRFIDVDERQRKVKLPILATEAEAHQFADRLNVHLGITDETHP
jgi:hypothetical protein